MIGEMYRYTPWVQTNGAPQHVAVQVGPESAIARGNVARFRIVSHEIPSDYVGLLLTSDFERIEPCP